MLGVSETLCLDLVGLWAACVDMPGVSGTLAVPLNLASQVMCESASMLLHLLVIKQWEVPSSLPILSCDKYVTNRSYLCNITLLLNVFSTQRS